MRDPGPEQLEICFGVAGGGFVCRALPSRRHPDERRFIVDDADDRQLFFGRTFLPAMAKSKPAFPSVGHVVLMGPCDVKPAQKRHFAPILLEGQ